MPVQRKYDSDDTYLDQQFIPSHKGFTDIKTDFFLSTEEGVLSLGSSIFSYVSAVDACIGVVVDALKSKIFGRIRFSLLRAIMDIILAKEFLFKGALWEEVCVFHSWCVFLKFR